MGFQVYGGAYSPYFTTLNSLSNTMNQTLSERDVDNVVLDPDNAARFRIVPNEYFRRMHAAGYRLRVYQSDFLDFCTAGVDPARCYSYPANSIRALEHAPLSVLGKSRLILASAFSNSSVFAPLYRNFAIDPGYWPVAVPEMFEKLKRDLGDLQRGDLFFVHVLLPHEPYVWNAQCSLRTHPGDWIHRHPSRHAHRSPSTPSHRENAYQYYFAQNRCALKHFDDVLTQLSQLELWNTLTIIVHGDHGSRITITDPNARTSASGSERDYLDAFSTLFAIRKPGESPKYDATRRALPALLSELVLNERLSTENGTVYLRADPAIHGNRLIENAMPEFGVPDS